jgi:hypothetical protein
MIKASDLRIGNLIMEAGEQSNVYAIDRGGISFYRINDIPVNKETGCTLNGGEDRFTPIPLTPEWLERCGFMRKENTMQVDGLEMTFQINESTYFSSCGGINGGLYVLCLCRGNYFANNLQYLHQLQNLYHALTGEELIITL